MTSHVSLLVVVVAACSSTSEPTKEVAPKRVPQQHRGDGNTACSPSPPGTPDPSEPGCHADADCKDGKNGRCNRVGNPHAGYRNQCGYDSCLADADCTGGGTCQCTGGGNYCLPGNCRNDADCADSHACSPTPSCPDLSGGNRGYAEGFYCHTPADTCIDDHDCSAKGDGFRCRFSREVTHWACTKPMCPMG